MSSVLSVVIGCYRLLLVVIGCHEKNLQEFTKDLQKIDNRDVLDLCFTCTSNVSLPYHDDSQNSKFPHPFVYFFAPATFKSC